MKKPATANSIVSEALREIRTRLKMGIWTLAKAVGSNATSITRCERGQRGLRQNVIQRICELASSHGMSDVAELLAGEALFARKWDTARKAKSAQPRNRIVVVGFPGLQRGYLNVTRKEAIRRWSKEAGMQPEEKDVHEIPFDDELHIFSFFDTKIESGGV